MAELSAIESAKKALAGYDQATCLLLLIINGDSNREGWLEALKDQARVVGEKYSEYHEKLVRVPLTERGVGGGV
jgi:hypothetical protein